MDMSFTARSNQNKSIWYIIRKGLLHSKIPYLYLVPALVFFTLFLVIPIIQSIYFSLFKYDGMTAMQYIGMENYKKLFSDGRFYNALRNTGIFMALNVVIQNAIAIPLAVILNGNIRMKNFFKSLFFLPTMFSVVVIGFVFQFIFNPIFGVLNIFLRQIGLDVLASNWLGDTKLALYSIIFVTCWQGIGYATVIYLGGLQSISHDIYEAADIDGSHGLNTFLKITFPMLAPVFTVSVIISTIANVREFGRIYVMTQGGPAGASEVIVTYIYSNFQGGYLGYGSAVSVILFAILMILSIIQLKLLNKRENF